MSLTATACLLLAMHAAAGVTEKPNILLVLADDLGYADLGCTGCRDIPTPNLDKLAAGGIRCTSAYVTAPYCAPSRAGLLTGRYQNRSGFEFNTSTFNGAGLPADEKTIARRLQKTGYKTGLIGKWNLGSAAGQHPLDRGFDQFYGFLGGSSTYFPGANRDRAEIMRNRNIVAEEEYLTDAFAREAVRFVNANKGQPWFLYVAFNAVHTPLEPKPDDLRKLSRVQGKLRKPYAGLLVSMDDAVGRILLSLEESGSSENTLVVFLNDNGGPTAPINSNVNGSENIPFRGGKRQLTEGGIRVPMLVRWPKGLPSGTTIDAPVSALDFAATALAAAGADPSTEPQLEGLDLLPTLAQSAASPVPRVLCWRFGKQWAIREGRWKLATWKHDDGRGFTTGLYDLNADAGETTDQSLAHPEVRERLERLWRDWNKSNKPPTFGTEGELAEADELHRFMSHGTN